MEISRALISKIQHGVKPLFVLGFAVFFAACAGGPSSDLKDNYRQALKLQSAGQWKESIPHFEKALELAQKQEINAAKLTGLHFEYGRALGVTCAFAESESQLTTALELDRQYSGPVFMDQIELARLNFDQKKFPAAIPFFERGFSMLDRLGVSFEDPIGYANLLDEYAQALERTGQLSKARNLRSQSSDLRRKYPKIPAKTQRTPYGKFCG